MQKRITVPLLAAAVIIFACGPRTHSNAAATGTTKTGSAMGIASNKGVLSSLVVDAKASDVRFSLAIQNSTNKRVELSFPDGRTHDFVVLDDVGREVWRWSASRMFTQSMQNRLLDARDSVVYDERWHAPPGAGKFTVVAVLNSGNYPIEKRVDFALP